MAAVRNADNMVFVDTAAPDCLIFLVGIGIGKEAVSDLFCTHGNIGKCFCAKCNHLHGKIFTGYKTLAIVAYNFGEVFAVFCNAVKDY